MLCGFYAAPPFCAESLSLFVCFFFSLLETVLEAFHFDHETLEKQLVTIENQGELSAPMIETLPLIAQYAAD